MNKLKKLLLPVLFVGLIGSSGTVKTMDRKLKEIHDERAKVYKQIKKDRNYSMQENGFGQSEI